jgi:hypothetical protein
MFNLGIVLLLFAAVLWLVMGVKYWRRTTFMTYQAAVVGKSWSELDSGTQAVMLGMLRVIGGGFAGIGLALLWLCLALYQGAHWAPWAILSISATTLGPLLYVTLTLRSVQPAANPPVREIVGGAVLTVAGVCAALFG